MKYHLKSVVFSGQEALIRRRGADIWERLCDDLTEPTWTTGDAAHVLMRRWGYTYVTARQYARAVLYNVLAEPSDNPPIQRQGYRWRWA